MKTEISVMSMCKTLLMLMFVMVFAACSSDDDPIFTATEDDAPRILNTDIPEWSNGEPGTLMTIRRDANFNFTIIATPVNYTTVSWMLDGEKIAEGNTIDQPVLAGNYLLKIVATTTKGKETYRVTRLVVLPCEGDPALENKEKERWLAPGAEAAIHGSNLESVVSVSVGGRECSLVSVADGVLRFAIPADAALGDYRLVLKDAGGNSYGGGKVTVTDEPYPVKEETVWEGSFNVTWGTPFDEMKGTMVNYCKDGTVLRAYVSGNGQGTATTAWWNNILTGKGDPERGDIMISGDQVLEYVMTDFSIELMKQQDGFLFVGDGYTLKRITVE